MHKKTILLFSLTLLYFLSFGQDEGKKIIYFENLIIKGNPPKETNVQIKYDKDYRVIVWNDLLIKDYDYSNKTLDKLDYEYLEQYAANNKQYTKIYRNCSKGIILKVTKIYNERLSISIEWFHSKTRSQIAYLMYCNAKK